MFCTRHVSVVPAENLHAQRPNSGLHDQSCVLWQYCVQYCGSTVFSTVAVLFSVLWQYCFQYCGSTAFSTVAVLCAVLWQYCFQYCGNTALSTVAVLCSILWQYCFQYFGSTVFSTVAVLLSVLWQYCFSTVAILWQWEKVLALVEFLQCPMCTPKAYTQKGCRDAWPCANP